MEPIIDFLQDNPAYLAGAVALLVVVVALLLRKMLKFALLGLLLLGLYTWYINDRAHSEGISKNLHRSIEDVKEAGKKMFD